MIDYGILAEAVEFYAAAGFTMVDAPWTVDPPAYLATKPRRSRELSAFGYGPCPGGGHLTASGEQSLLHMWRNGSLPEGRDLMCVTPCWRAEEQNEDGLHLPYFMKLELMVNLAEERFPYEKLLYGLVSLACQFFARYLPVKTKDIPCPGQQEFDRTHGCADHGGSIDVESLDGVELGSYGVRSWRTGPGDEGTFRWIYGTGVALPRLSQAVKRDGGKMELLARRR